MDSGLKVAGAMTPEQIRDALLSLADNERKFVITEAEAGERKIVSIRHNAAGHIEYDAETLPE